MTSCVRLPGIGNRNGRYRRLQKAPKRRQKNKEQRTRVRCSPACTLPQVLRQVKPYALKLLVERQKTLTGRFAADRRAGGLNANHSIFKRAEAADTSLVNGDRAARGEIRHGRRTTGAG